LVLALPVGRSTLAPNGDTSVERMMKKISSRNTMSVMLDMLKLTLTLFLDLMLIIQLVLAEDP
jgi:hypothetical protein